MKAADWPGACRGPKVTATDRRVSTSWLRHVLGMIALLLLPAWLLGWTDSACAEEVETDASVVEETEERVVTVEPASGAVGEVAAGGSG